MVLVHVYELLLLFDVFALWQVLPLEEPWLVFWTQLNMEPNSGCMFFGGEGQAGLMEKRDEY